MLPVIIAKPAPEKGCSLHTFAHFRGETKNREVFAVLGLKAAAVLQLGLSPPVFTDAYSAVPSDHGMARVRKRLQGRSKMRFPHKDVVRQVCGYGENGDAVLGKHPA